MKIPARGYAVPVFDIISSKCKEKSILFGMVSV
jgi:hypothetical protein